MTLRPLLIPTVCAFAALTACDDSVRISSTRGDSDGKGVLKVVETLQCPQTMGSLTRKGSASAAGTICTYVGPKGAEVSLHLVPLDGETPAKVLTAFEQRLSRALPHAVERLKSLEPPAAEGAARAEADEAEPEDASGPRATGDRATVRAPGVEVNAHGEDATVRLPGVRIETRGDKASVRIGGFQIDADDSDGSARISGAGGGGENVSINARNDSAEIRTSASGAATRSSWILTDNRPSDAGWRLVGYEARGPVGGPLVVAVVRSRDTNRSRGFEDAKALVTLNAGE